MSVQRDGEPPSEAVPGIGLGILSWKGYPSLTHALESYASADFLKLFAERHLFLPEEANEGHAIAQRFGMTSSGAARNLGILGGFDRLAHALTSPIVVLLENDLPLIEPLDLAADEIRQGAALLKSGKAQVVRLRSRRLPGADLSAVKYHRYFPRPEDGPTARTFKAALRALRPGKARRVSALSLYACEDPASLYPQVVRRDPETGFFLVSAGHIPWSNLGIMIEREFFLERILGYAKRAPVRRQINGFRNIEIEMNSPYWRRSGWHVATRHGLFTHARVGDRGY